MVVEPVLWRLWSASFDGGPVQQGTIRVTQVYRREEGRWLLVHRHGDPV